MQPDISSLAEASSFGLDDFDNQEIWTNDVKYNQAIKGFKVFQRGV